jgi:hypothetical protein
MVVHRMMVGMETTAGGAAGQGRRPEGMPLGISSGRGHRPAVIDGRGIRPSVARGATV